MGIGCSLQTFVNIMDLLTWSCMSLNRTLFVQKRGPFCPAPGPFCPGTWSVLSRDMVRFVLKRGPFCLVRFVQGPFCPSTFQNGLLVTMETAKHWPLKPCKT